MNDICELRFSGKFPISAEQLRMKIVQQETQRCFLGVNKSPFSRHLHVLSLLSVLRPFFFPPANILFLLQKILKHKEKKKSQSLLGLWLFDMLQRFQKLFSNLNNPYFSNDQQQARQQIHLCHIRSDLTCIFFFFTSASTISKRKRVGYLTCLSNF